MITNPFARRGDGSDLTSRLASALGDSIAPATRVWAFTLVLAATAAAVWAGLARGLEPDFASELPWPIVAVALYLAEIKVVDVHFRRETHSFSLSEVATVIGLFTLNPIDYLLAATIGPGVALVYPARQPPVKIAFNVANYALVASISFLIFHGIAPSPHGFDPPVLGEWLAAFATTLSATAICAVSIATVITLSGGAPQFQKIPEMLQFGGLVAFANTSIGLLAVWMLRADPRSLLLLAVPLLAVFLAYRAYVSEREKMERLELLYRSSRILHNSPELDSTLVALLDHAREMFRAERTEILLFSSDPGGAPLRTTTRLDRPPEIMVAAPGDPTDPFWCRMKEARRAFIYAPDWAPDHTPAVRQALVSPLAGEAGVIGFLWVANRLGEGSSYDESDLRLLDTLANQVAVALENSQLEQSLAELSRLKDQLRHQAYHDPLTNMGNRVLFIEEVEARLSHPIDGRMAAIVFLDLDDFKLINDTLGHEAGDTLLVAVAQRLRACVRFDDMPARLGGDEFAVLVSDDQELGGALALAARIHDELRVPFPLLGQEVVVSASIGIAAATAEGMHAAELLRNADVAMYTAKSDGKARVAVFEPTMHATIVARHELSADLTRGVAAGELALFYQPIVALGDGRVTGIEALVRWNHPTRGIIAPDQFIRLAEENGSIAAIGRWVLIEACRQAAAWHRRRGADDGFYVSVNVSSRQLKRAEFIGEVAEAIRGSGLDPRALVLEMTETAMFQDTHATITKLDHLRELGVRIALDDFGTGYSSLSYLRRFPVDILKIAREFVGSTDAATEEWALAHAIIALARTLDLQVIAEGIEEPGQLERLRSLGCEFGQGYLFARPADAVATEALLFGEGDAASPPTRRTDR